MNPSLLSRFQYVSEKIEEAAMAEFSRLAMLLCGEESESEEPEDVRKRTNREHTTIISLRALRIQINLEMIKEGNRDHLEEFKEDFDKVYNSIKVLEYAWEDRNEYLADAVDAILLIRPGNRKALLKQLPLTTRLKIQHASYLKPELYFVLRDMSRYYIDNGFAREGKNAIKNLICLSEERNAGKIKDHRELVGRQLEYVVDHYPDLTAEICSEQEKHFHGTVDGYSAWFYWYWGCALRTLGDHTATKKAFQMCSRICFDIEGGDSWLGSLAKQRYCSIGLLLDNEADKEPYLWDFIHKLDDEYFPDVDRNFARITSAEIRYQLLSFHLGKQNLKGLFKEIKTFLSFCMDFNPDPQYPLFKMRLAYNLLSGYYLETGDYLQAADAATNALEAVPPEGTPVIIEDYHIISNLLLIYCALGDFERMAFYRDALAEHLEDEDLKDKDYYRFLTLIGMADTKLGIVDEEDLEDNKKTLIAVYKGIQDGSFDDPQSCDASLVQWVLTAMASVNDTFQTSTDEFAMYEEILQFILANVNKFGLLDNQTSLVYMELARIYWIQHDSRALDYIKECIAFSGNVLSSSESKITILRIAAVICNEMNQSAFANQYADEAMRGITTAWQKATSCLNDHRVCQMLAFALNNVSVCYAIRRPKLSEKERYEYVLKYKDLPALVGKERNRVLRSYATDDPLREKIYSLQDKIAEIEAGNIFRGDDDVVALRNQLHHLETEFAKKFPEAINFTTISFDRVGAALPEHSGILEYYISPVETKIGNDPLLEAEWQIEVFVTAKTNGVVRLNSFVVRDAADILNCSETFVSILQQQADLATMGQKESQRAKLYRSLVAPALSYLNGVNTLFLAPDLDLCNLPFEILFGSGDDRLENQFRIVRLVCGRDLLFYDNRPGRGGALVLGGPDYEAERGEISSDFERSADLKLKPVKALPFSHVEAKTVARRCRTESYTGKAATKYVLQNAGPSRIIHLATHGYFDRSLETDSLYSSCLVFAGANKWLSQGLKSKQCGNGILTADEISRMDLRGTDLVVLSACRSSLGDTSYGTSQGLLSGFSAAGARWVVSHVWKAVDFVSPVLMNAFYEAYLTKGMEVPEALQYGKERLRNITVAELRQEGWLSLDPDVQYSSEDVKFIESIAKRNDRNKPFADEHFWSGFVCHKFR